MNKLLFLIGLFLIGLSIAAIMIVFGGNIKSIDLVDMIGCIFACICGIGFGVMFIGVSFKEQPINRDEDKDIEDIINSQYD